MQHKILSILFALMLYATSIWADSGQAGTDPLQQLESRAAEVKSGKVAEYAPEALKEALTAVTAAQASSGGSPKLSQQKQKMASLLLTVAEAKAAERELLEKVAVQRVELKKLEAQLERNLQGEEKP